LAIRFVRVVARESTRNDRKDPRPLFRFVWQADFFHSPTFISNDDVGVECVMADELPELHDFCRMLASDEISGLSVIYDEVHDS
jgi:hypothetical protein